MLVTIIGAGTGISKGVAKLFGSKGFNIALIARNEDKLKQEVSELESLGIKAMYAVGDAASENSLYDALGKVLQTMGHANMILYNPSVMMMKNIESETWDSIKQQLDVNAGGAFHLLKKVLPYCKKENTGKLFFTGGGLSMYPQPNLVGLSVGKAALRNLVYGTAAGLKGTNVHVATVTVCGFVNENDSKYNPTAIAEQFWKLYNQKQDEFQTEIVY